MEAIKRTDTARYDHKRRYRGHMHNVDVGVGGISLSLLATVCLVCVAHFATLFFLVLFEHLLFLVYDTLLPSTGGWAHIFSVSLDIKMLESVIDSSFHSD